MSVAAAVEESPDVYGLRGDDGGQPQQHVLRADLADATASKHATKANDPTIGGMEPIRRATPVGHLVTESHGLLVLVMLVLC